MASYRLVNQGYPFKKIYHGRRWVGRVVKHATKEHCYVGKIGKIFVEASTELGAFEQVVAQQLGFKNVVELKMENQARRAENRVRNARARAWAHRFTHGTLKDKLDVLDEVFNNVETGG